MDIIVVILDCDLSLDIFHRRYTSTLFVEGIGFRQPGTREDSQRGDGRRKLHWFRYLIHFQY